MRPLEPLEGHGRAVADHRGHHVGEVLAELGDARADPDDHDQQLQRDDHVDERQHGEEEQRGKVLLAPGAEEDRLVPQPDQHQQHDRGDQQHRVDQAGGVVRQSGGQARGDHPG
jgi:hypothetical protein